MNVKCLEEWPCLQPRGSGALLQLVGGGDPKGELDDDGDYPA